MTVLVRLLMSLALAGPIIAFSGRFPLAKVTVAVIDEADSPVGGATVGISGTLQPQQDESTKGLTDPNGIFSADVSTDGEIGVGVDKTGYYHTQLPYAYSFPDRWHTIESATRAGRWNQSPTVRAVLKTIIHPIPMRVRRLNGLPKNDGEVALDLMAGDFVAPRGSGRSGDFIFKVQGTNQGENGYDYALTISFPNKLDGILPFEPDSFLRGSKLRSPHNAPESGYHSQWVVKRSRRRDEPEVSNFDPEKHGYFFRIRTVADAQGKIISANYGKIYGDFMNFTYYLNPTPNDRNVEFDPKRNLFTNLKPDEQVTAP